MADGRFLFAVYGGDRLLVVGIARTRERAERQAWMTG